MKRYEVRYNVEHIAIVEANSTDEAIHKALKEDEWETAESPIEAEETEDGDEAE